jgi:hypothetical protein
MPTINFHLGSATVNWDGGNSIGVDQLAGLVNQARRNIDGAQEGDLPPLDSPIVVDIVDFETSLSTAQIFSFRAGLLDAGGARGGPEALSLMTRVAGRFDLFDAWINSPIAARAKIARGQELFNNPNSGGGRCGACHNSANNGTNISNTLFDIGTASAEARPSDLPLYTLCRRNPLTPTVSCVGDPTAEIRQVTDTGRGNVPRQRHRGLDRPRPLQDADDPGAGCARTVLPQRHCQDPRGRRAPLRAVPGLCLHRSGARRPRGLPGGALIQGRRPPSGRARRLANGAGAPAGVLHEQP